MPLRDAFAAKCAALLQQRTKRSGTVLGVVRSKGILRYPEKALNVLFDLWPATRLPQNSLCACFRFLTPFPDPVSHRGRGVSCVTS
jgi:hypothetical protein